MVLEHLIDLGFLAQDIFCFNEYLVYVTTHEVDLAGIGYVIAYAQVAEVAEPVADLLVAHGQLVVLDG